MDGQMNPHECCMFYHFTLVILCTVDEYSLEVGQLLVLDQ